MGKATTMLEAGEQAPAEVLRIAGHDGRSPVLLAFFKVSCPTCQFTLPFLERLHQRADGDLRVVGMSQDGEEATEDFCRHFGLTYPVVLDHASEGYPASNRFRISFVPSMFLIEADGRISWADHGFGKENLSRMARRFDVDLFTEDDNVPQWRAG